MSLLSIAIGANARASGICNVAIGDYCVAQGAYRVVTSDKISLPDNLSVSSALQSINEMRELKNTFVSMGAEKVAPATFADEAGTAIDKAIEVIYKHLGIDEGDQTKLDSALRADAKYAALAEKVRNSVLDETLANLSRQLVKTPSEVMDMLIKRANIKGEPKSVEISLDESVREDGKGKEKEGGTK